MSLQELHSNLLGWHCRVICQSHVVVVLSAALLVYTIDRDCASPALPSSMSTAQCVLMLPAWPNGNFSSMPTVQSYIRCPPPLDPDDRPHHRHDPDLTLLTLDVRFPTRKSEGAQCAMFIPVSTITALAERPHPPSPYRKWGPAGTRIAHLGSGAPFFQFSPMGCSCAVTQRRNDPASDSNLNTRSPVLRVLVLDVHPWAGPGAAQRNTNTNTLLLLRDTAPEEDGVRTRLRSPRPSFPFAVSRRDLPVGRDDRRPTTVVLAEDGLVLLVRASRSEFRGG
uniref:Cell surface hydrophobicity-associated protein n=1 Tax=Ganoderma boninense TaxID=34458 RepID=A0A5K1K0Q4_9APHY